MKKVTLLVTGRYGFLGRIGNANIDVTQHFDNLWILNYDGTPEGYQSVWVDAKLDCVLEITKFLKASCNEVVITLPSEKGFGATLSLPGFTQSLVGHFQYLSVVGQF